MSRKGWTGESQRHSAARKGIKTIGTKPKKQRIPYEDEIEVDTWFERDRASIVVTDTKTGKVIAEWWDDEVQNMIDSGFFSTRKLETSVIGYLVQMGIVKIEDTHISGDDNANYGFEQDLF